MYYGPPMTFAQFQRELKAAIKHNENLHLRKDLHDMGKRQESLMDELRLDGKARSLVELSQCVLWQKGYRKDVEYHGFYSYEPLLREIARRKKERDWRNLLFLTPRELKGLILHGTPSIHDAKERRKFSCLIAKKDGVKTLTGHRARTFYDGLALENGLSKLTGTSGQCAYPGKARGIAKKILVPEDMKKMKKGDIIVSQATSPDLMPAIHKAAAIVTNTGGLICHAAIIARELKIPCIVGTANATRIFEDGDTIEVDAIKGTVRKIK
jgi:phosphohistidine swiveling domain-containing protein